jgi:hypothetical protein
MVASTIVDSEFDFVGLVNVNFVQLVSPSVVLRSFRSSLENVLNLNYDEGVRPSTEAASGSMVYIRYGVYPNRKVTSQRLSLARNVQTVVCTTYQQCAGLVV